MIHMSKKINEMLKVIRGDISKTVETNIEEVDTIVNAAKPTLMGSNQGVDGAIHVALDRKLGGEGEFNKKICEELKTIPGNMIIRCKRGQAITTGGGGLCKYVIHVVGAKYDGKEGEECTSSCVKTLESCYSAIIEEIKKRPDIKVVGIPIIGAGEYNVPYHIAAEIAVASIGNALVKWKKEDEEMFEMASLQQIVFFVFSPEGQDSEKAKNYESILNELLGQVNPILKKERRIVYHTS